LYWYFCSNSRMYRRLRRRIGCPFVHVHCVGGTNKQRSLSQPSTTFGLATQHIAS
jgi:hypothetical protein